MKKYHILLATGIILLVLTGFAWACPGRDPNDPGVCDTLYVICHDSIQVGPPPWEVHFTLLVTHDMPDPAQDSISGMTIPLKLTHTNPTAYCSLSSHRNRAYPLSDTTYNIFRHFGGRENYMMSLYEEGNGAEWGTMILDLGEDHFWLILAASTEGDQRWGPGSQVLLATMTLLVEDTMTVCVDTMLFLSTWLKFGAGITPTYTYRPQHNMPVCAKIRSVQRGDVDGDGEIDLADVLYLISYLYKNGPAPASDAGDVDCNGEIELGDVLYLISYLYKGGPPPGCP